MKALHVYNTLNVSITLSGTSDSSSCLLMYQAKTTPVTHKYYHTDCRHRLDK